MLMKNFVLCRLVLSPRACQDPYLCIITNTYIRTISKVEGTGDLKSQISIMATEEDNFDIDIYGDGGEDYQEEGQVEPEEGNQITQEPTQSSESAIPKQGTFAGSAEPISNGHGDTYEIPNSPELGEQTDNVARKIGSTDESALDPLNLPKQAPQAQGMKRKEGNDDRFVDPGATTALFISDLHWWITDDDIRGWANQSECEDELEDMTFSEHKVNGKSKGYVQRLKCLSIGSLTICGQTSICSIQVTSSSHSSQTQDRIL